MLHPGRALVAAVLSALLAIPMAAAAEATSASGPGPVDIVNGVPTNLQPTTGALLFVGPDLKNQFLDCSAVLVGCRTVLTAAHCVCKTTDNFADCVKNDLPALDVADLRVFFQHSGFHHVRDVFVDPGYLRGVGSDLAILRLSERVEGIEPSPIHRDYPTSVEHGTAGVIVGFGKKGDASLAPAIKRVGSVTTSACPAGSVILEPGNICWDFQAPIAGPGQESGLCRADDGGPLLVDFGNGPELTGIHAGGGPSCNADSFSYGTAVSPSRLWLDVVGGPDLSNTQCSDLPEVGESFVTVRGDTGDLPRSEDEQLFTYDIPVDATLLRVTVNGDTEKQGDYDLFVGLGNKIPTRFDNDCQARGAGQFGACSFADPGVGRVNVLVRHVTPDLGTGHSRFQVTVSAWEPKPPGQEPAAPDQLRYSRRAPGYRRLTWLDVSSDETGFQLQRRLGVDPSNEFRDRATLAPGKTFFLDHIADDQAFTYRVRSFNRYGSSEWSNLCIVNLAQLARPTRVHAEDVTAGQVILRWRDNASGESRMEIQRRLVGSLAWKTVKLMPPDSRRWIDDGVAAGATYEYRVRARGYVDQCVKHSLYSAVFQVTVPAS